MRLAQRIDLNRVERVAIVKMSSIGDVVHALPVSAALKRSFPHLQLSWIVDERCAEIVVGNPCLHEVISLPLKTLRTNLWQSQRRRLLRQTIRDLRSRRFEVTIDLQGLLKSAVVAWLTGAPYRFGYYWQREGAWLFNRVVPRHRDSVHVVDVYLDVARFLGAQTEPVEFPLYIPPEAQQRVSELLEQAGVAPPRRFLSINLSGGQSFKRWPVVQWARFIEEAVRRYDIPIVVVGSRADLPLVEQLSAFTSAPFISFVGKTNLKELAALMRYSLIHICGDTGSGHIAAALGTPVIGLYGATSPLRSGPYGQLHRVVSYREDPDTHHATLMAERPEYMERIRVEDVLQRLEQTLGEVSIHA